MIFRAIHNALNNKNISNYSEQDKTLAVLSVRILIES